MLAGGLEVCPLALQTQQRAFNSRYSCVVCHQGTCTKAPPGGSLSSASSVPVVVIPCAGAKHCACNGVSGHLLYTYCVRPLPQCALARRWAPPTGTWMLRCGCDRYGIGGEGGPTATPTCCLCHGTFLERGRLQTGWQPRRIAARSLARLVTKTSAFPRGASATPSGQSPPPVPLGGMQQRCTLRERPLSEAGSDTRGHLWVTWGVYLCAGKPPLADIRLSHPPDLT